MKRVVFVLLCVFGVNGGAAAQILELGTWVQRGSSNTPLVMTIEPVGGGRRITYRVRQPDGKIGEQVLMTLLTQLDGKDAPVMAANGQPTGETMAIRRIDATHAVAVLKMDGKDFGTSRAELSADGKVLKVENEITFAQSGQNVGKQTEYWDKK